MKEPHVRTRKRKHIERLSGKGLGLIAARKKKGTTNKSLHHTISDHTIVQPLITYSRIISPIHENLQTLQFYLSK